VCEVGPPMPQNHSSVKSSESFETKGRVLATFQKEFRPLRQGTHNSKMGGANFTIFDISRLNSSEYSSDTVFRR